MRLAEPFRAKVNDWHCKFMERSSIMGTLERSIEGKHLSYRLEACLACLPRHAELIYYYSWAYNQAKRDTGDNRWHMNKLNVTLIDNRASFPCENATSYFK